MSNLDRENNHVMIPEHELLIFVNVICL